MKNNEHRTQSAQNAQNQRSQTKSGAQNQQNHNSAMNQGSMKQNYRSQEQVSTRLGDSLMIQAVSFVL